MAADLRQVSSEDASGQGPIVVGVDGSAASLAALVWAAREARLRTAELVVVRAWTPQHRASYAPAASRPSHRDEHDQAARELAAAIRQTVGVAPLIPLRPRLVRGAPAKVLLAEAAGADLLVLGGPQADAGHAPVHQPPISAVVAACLRHATCPVVIIATSLGESRRRVSANMAGSPMTAGVGGQRCQQVGGHV